MLIKNNLQKTGLVKKKVLLIIIKIYFIELRENNFKLVIHL